jgi:hypothetical protein
MFCCNVVAEFEWFQANTSKPPTCRKPLCLLVLSAPANVSIHKLKLSAGIRNPMLYPTELQAPGLSIHRWQLIKFFHAIFTIFKTTRKHIRRGRRPGCAPGFYPEPFRGPTAHAIRPQSSFVPPRPLQNAFGFAKRTGFKFSHP